MVFRCANRAYSHGDTFSGDLGQHLQNQFRRSVQASYELVPRKFWKRAITGGYLPQEAEEGQVYIRCNYFDEEIKSLWCVVSGDVFIANRQVRNKPFVMAVAQKDFSLSFAKQLPKPPTKAPPVRMASEGLRGSGTGFFVSPQGLILTCAHLIDRATVIRVATASGSLNAAVVYQNPRFDIAVLKANVSAPVPYLTVTDSRAASLGLPVFTIGFPNPTIQGFSPSSHGERLAPLADLMTTLQSSRSVYPFKRVIQVAQLSPIPGR